MGPDYYADLVWLLPNVRYPFPDGTVSTVCDAVVVGEVVAVSTGKGHPAGDVRPHDVDFDAPHFAWKTI